MNDRVETASGASHVRLILAMSHARTRAAVRRVLDATGEVDVVAEVASALQMVQTARSEGVDVVLLDLQLVASGTSPTLATVAARLRGVPIVAVGLDDDPAFARAALAAGAITHVLTDASPEEYLGAIRAAADR